MYKNNKKNKTILPTMISKKEERKYIIIYITLFAQKGKTVNDYLMNIR